MNVMILGGKTGFGSDIADHIVKPMNQLVYPLNKLLLTDRQDLDFNNGEWVTRLRELMTDAFGGPSGANVIVLAAYDRANQQDNMQLRVAATLFDIFRTSQTHLMFIGDMRHHIMPIDSMYLANKRDLWKASLKWAGDNRRRCPLTLYEPYSTGLEAVSEMSIRIAPGVPGEFYCVTHALRNPTLFERLA